MKEFNLKLQEQFKKMALTNKLFRVSFNGRELWDLYLESFAKKVIFRDPNSTVNNCNLCNNFIRRYGNLVAIDADFNIISLFDIKLSKDNEYKPVVDTLSKIIKKSKISEVFFETFTELNKLNYERCNKSNATFRLGLDKNVKQYNKAEAEMYFHIIDGAKFYPVKEGEIRTFNHLHLDLPTMFVDMGSKSVEAIMGEYRDAKNVFGRALNEIPLDTLNLVRDLINQGSLLDGQTHLYKLDQIIPLKAEYDTLSAKQKDNWLWVKSYKLAFAKFKNELIGVLCSDLAEGTDLNKACQDWNRRVDPVNFMKTTAPITKRQIEDAKRFVEENNYTESFNRRYANISDIKVSEILHSNIGDNKINAVSIFDDVKPSVSTRHKKSEFDNIEEVSIEKFMNTILPTCTSVEVFLNNNQEGNLVTLTTANDKESKPIFKWDNNYSWTYNGNLAGKSQIKEAVKSAGGKVDGVLRFSITWNEDGRDLLDFDAHALEPNGGEHIYFSNYKGHKTKQSGMLDVDMIRPSKLGVENIVWSDRNLMKDGVYKLWIKNFDGGRNKGFKAEIEFDGEMYTYNYNQQVTGETYIAEVTLKNGRFTIKHLLPCIEGEGISKEIYGLETNKFHKVNLICLSPNHWSNTVGNKHYFFMLDKCTVPSSIRSFHNENLLPELAEHRKVLEVLGSTYMIPKTNDKQLSGLGFNATVKDEVIVKLQGSFKRTVKIKF